MVYRTRIKYTAEQKAEMWDRWQQGESLSSIGRVFDRQSSSIYGLLAPTGGIRPPERKRSRLALTLSEREEISRGIAQNRSLVPPVKSALFKGQAGTVILAVDFGFDENPEPFSLCQI